MNDRFVSPVRHFTKTGARFVLAAASLLSASTLVVACSAAPQDAEETDLESEAATTAAKSVCANGSHAVKTVDGVAVFECAKGDDNFYVWANSGTHTAKSKGSGGDWVETEKSTNGYQCAEFASRYQHFNFGTSSTWGAYGAKDMCDSHPSSVTKTSKPKHGDLMVFAPGAPYSDCISHGSEGHVAVVTSVSGSKIGIVQQNESPVTDTIPEHCASCFLHSSGNDACYFKAAGTYCGQTSGFPYGASGTLYTCGSKKVKDELHCSGSCVAGSGDAHCGPPLKKPLDAPDETDETTESDDSASTENATE